METSEELEYAITESKILSDEHLTERDIYSEPLSIIPDDELEKEDLHIVGFKVQLGNDQAFSFDLEKALSKSPDVLTALESSKKVLGQHISQEHQGGTGGIRQSFSVPSGDVQTLTQTHLENSKKAESIEEVDPILELKLSSFDKENEEFELHIKSKNDGRDVVASEDESLGSCSDYYDTHDQLVSFSEANSLTPASSCIRLLYETSVVPIKYISEISSNGTQTEKEIGSSSMQTTSFEVLNPRSMQEASIQTDRKEEVSTSTENIRTESVKTETNEVPEKQKTVQTEEELVTGCSQTETAGIFSIDRAYDGSTQTDQVAEAATSTDFDIYNIYIVDTNIKSEKALDTEDLPFTPLVAKEEKIESEYEITDSKTCEDQKQCECIYKCCYHPNCDGMIPSNLLQCNNKQFSSCGTSKGNLCNSCSEINSLEIHNKHTAKIRSSLHQLYCCKCKISGSSSNSNVQQEAVKQLKLPNSLQVTEGKYSSLAMREKLFDLTKMEIIKNQETKIEKMKTVVAIRIHSVLKVERASILKIPVLFQHRLNSFSLSVYGPSQVVINPIKISLSVSQSSVSEKSTGEQLKLDTRLLPDAGLRDKMETHLLAIYDGMKAGSVVVSCTPSITAADDEQSQARLCNDCYSNVQCVLREKRKRCMPMDSESHASHRIEDNLSAMTESQTRSTSPKINHKAFNYTAKDMWTPYGQTRNDVLNRKVEPTDIVHFGNSDSEQSEESGDDIDLNSACEVVNDHILSLRPVDEDNVRKAAETVHKAWFEIAATKESDVLEVRFYIRYFQEFSNNLLKTLLHSVDDNGNNVLHFGFANNRFDLVKEFLSHVFADDLLNKPNKTGNSPLTICAISQPKTDTDWSVIRSSFERGNTNAKSKKSGQTPLMNAASCGFYAMVDLLLDVGANPNQQDKDGSTALMYAAEHGHESCVKALMRHKKCDPTIRDKDGQTACSIALSNGHKNIAILIHMQTLEKRRLSKNFYTSKRYIWTNNENRKKSLSVVQRSQSTDSQVIP